MNDVSTSVIGGFALINGVEPEIPALLTIGTSIIDVTSMTATRPDMAWQALDADGHFHAWSRERTLPTLYSVNVHEGCPCEDLDDDNCVGTTVTRWHCRICSAVVEPAYVPDTERKTITGPRSWQIEVRGVTEAVGKASVLFRSRGGSQRFGVAEPRERTYSSTNGPLTVLVGVSELGER